MKFQCIKCNAILSIKYIYMRDWTYKSVLKEDVFNCPNCQDMMIYKPNILRNKKR